MSSNLPRLAVEAVQRILSRSNGTISPITSEELKANFLKPAIDGSRAIQVVLPRTTKTGLPRKGMKWTCERYYKIINIERAYIGIEI